MPNLFRTLDGKVWKAGDTLPLLSADGTVIAGIWAGSAKEEILDWWLRKPGSQLTQTAEVAAIASKAGDTGEMVWGDAPPASRLLFVLEAPAPGKDYRLAKMLTTAATPQEIGWFRHDRFARFGTLDSAGRMQKIASLAPPPPPPPAQPGLF